MGNLLRGVLRHRLIPYVFLEAEGWVNWIEENFNELQEIKATRDKDLPVKIEVAISEQFN